MLPNEILDKIFKYQRWEYLKNFCQKWEKINQEYREKFQFVEEKNILISKISDINGYHFRYNYRCINRCPLPLLIRDIYHPKPELRTVASLSKNYCYSKK